MSFKPLDALKIYKKGQGAWARSISAVALALFLLWGCVELYNAQTTELFVGKPDDALTKELIDRIRAAGIDEVSVKNGETGRVVPLDQVPPDGSMLLQAPARGETWWATTAFSVPFIEVAITRGHLVTLGVLAPGALLVYWLVNRRRNAEFLVETEAELKKVSWSSKKEVIASSKVVMVFVAIMAVLLLFYDVVYKNIIVLLVGLVKG